MAKKTKALAGQGKETNLTRLTSFGLPTRAFYHLLVRTPRTSVGRQPDMIQPQAHITTGDLTYQRTNAPSMSRNMSSNPFELSLDYAYQPRKLKVFTIGAGFSGLLMAHKFQHRFPDMKDMVEHTIFEARSEVGGTWFVNNYPGVQCDVPAHIYVRFPFSDDIGKLC